MTRIRLRFRSLGIVLVLAGLTAQLAASPATLSANSLKQALDSQFVAVGWSTDGKFAWMERLDPGLAAPLVFVRVGVLDAVEDTILFDQTINVDPGDDNVSTARTLFATAGFKEFQQQLKSVGIQAGDPGQLTVSPFPYQYLGTKLTVRRMVQTAGGEGDGFNPSKIWSLWVDRSTKGSKKIAGATEPMTGIEVLGWLRSPFEKRILVVAAISRRGVEGDTSTRTIFSGCYLESGFAK